MFLLKEKRSGHLSLLDLLAEDLLEGDGVSSELADTLGELVDGHGVLVMTEQGQGEAFAEHKIARLPLHRRRIGVPVLFVSPANTTLFRQALIPA